MRKTVRKSLSLFLSMLLIFGTLAFALPLVGAVDDALEIHLGETLDVQVAAGEMVYFKFVPEATDTYFFSSLFKTYRDTYGYLYNAEKEEITKNDDDGGSGNFKISCTLQAGVTYYFGARFYNSTDSGTMPVNLTSVSLLHAGLDIQKLALNTAADFTVTADKALYLELDPSNNGRYFISLNATENVSVELLSSDFSNVTTYYNETEFSFEIDLASGVYFLRLTTESESVSLTALFQTMQQHVDPDAIVLTKDVPAAAELEAGGNVYLKFVPAVTGSYTLVGNHSQYLYINFYYEDLYYSYDAVSGNTGVEMQQYLQAGQTYYYRVESDAQQTVEMTVYTSTDLVNARALPLTFNTPQALSFTTYAEQKYLKFIPESTESYTLVCDNTSDLYGRALDVNLSELKEQTGTALAMGVALVRGQTYYFELTSYATQNTTVQIIRTEDYLNSISIDLAVNVPAQGENGKLLRFTPETDGVYMFSAQSEDYMSARFYDSEMNSDYNDYTYGMSIQLPRKLTAGETYYYSVDVSATCMIETLADYMANHGGKQIVSGEEVPFSGSDWTFFALQTGTKQVRYILEAQANAEAEIKIYSADMRNHTVYYFSDPMTGEIYPNSDTTVLVAVRSTSAEGAGKFTLTEMSAFLPGKAQPLTLDTPVTVTENRYTYFSFTPETDGGYVFCGTAQNNANFYSYREDTFDTQQSGSNDCVFMVSMKAGKTYYFAVNNYGGSPSPTVIIRTAQAFMHENATALALDTPQKLTFGPSTEYRYLMFTPEVTGRYTFSANNTRYVSCYAYNDMFEEIDSFSADEALSYSMTLEAGETYYFQWSCYEASFDVTLSKTCDHANAAIIPGVAPTCTVNGKTVGVRCEDCGKVLFEPVIIAKGHKDADADRVCDNCGQAAVEFVAACNNEGTVTATLYTNGELVLAGEGPVTMPPGRPQVNAFESEGAYQAAYQTWVQQMRRVTSIELPEGITSLCGSAFSECPVNEIVIPSSCNYIGSYAFYSAQFKDVTILNDAVRLSNQFPIEGYTTSVADFPLKNWNDYRALLPVVVCMQYALTLNYQLDYMVQEAMAEFGISEEIALVLIDDVYSQEITYLAWEFGIDFPEGTKLSNVQNAMLAFINEQLGTDFSDASEIWDVDGIDLTDPEAINEVVQHPSEAVRQALETKYNIDYAQMIDDSFSTRSLYLGQNGNNLDGKNYVAFEGITIHGNCGSTTQTAAAKIGADFDLLNHNPAQAVRENEVAATEETEGSYDSVVYCSTCGEELSRESKTIPVLGHEHTEGAPVRENEVAATCTKAGSYDEVVYCASCGEELSRDTYSIEKTAHTPAAVVMTNYVDATCTTNGGYDEVVLCTACGALLSSEHKTVEASGHSAGEPVIVNKVFTDCTEGGTWDEVVFCTICGEELSREAKEIAPAAHTPGEAKRENVKDATCEADGSYTEIIDCAVCGNRISAEEKTIKAPGHSWGEWVVVKEATQDEDGLQRRVCTRDGSHVEEKIIEKLPAPTQPDNGGKNLCKYCGEEHTGPFGWLIRFFHSILAFFGLRK